MDNLNKLKRYNALKEKPELVVVEIDRLDKNISEIKDEISTTQDSIKQVVEDTTNLTKEIDTKIDTSIKEVTDKIDNIKLQKGDKGDDYILTENDKIEIASSIKVPIVEKIVEKIQVIEQPIYNTEVKEIQTIKEDISGETIVERINSQYNKIKKDKVEGIDELERRLSTSINRYSTIGGGISKVFHDSSLTGDGTSDRPLSVGSGAYTDEKVKHNASDTTAGYLDDKITKYNYITSSALTGYVPYTGATTDVDLGIHNITSTGTANFGSVYSNSSITTNSNMHVGYNITSGNPILYIYGYDSTELVVKSSQLYTSVNGDLIIRGPEGIKFAPNDVETTKLYLTPEGNLALGTSITTTYGRLYITSNSTTAFERIIKLGTGATTVGAGSFIEFPSSSADGYGARIGGIRDGALGANALVFQTGTNAQTTKLKINDIGDTYLTNDIALSESTTVGGIKAKLSIVTGRDENTAVMINTRGGGYGSGIIGGTDDGSATASGDRLGYFGLAGAYDTTHDLKMSAGLFGYADGNWTSTSTPSYMYLATTPSGSVTRVNIAKFGSNGLSEFYGINSSTLPQLGNATYASFIMARTGRQYGIAYGVKDNTGEGWIQAQRFDGTATAYDLLLQPSGGFVKRGIEQSIVSGTIFTQTADKTVGNTTTETSLVGTGSGSVTLPANTLKAGTTIRIKMKGYVSGVNGDTSTLKIKLGSTELATSTGTWQTLTGVGFDFEFDLTCRTAGATGTVIGQGRSLVAGGQGFSTVTMRALTMSTTTTINTTASQTIDLTYTWGTASASDTITITNLTAEILR